MKNLNMKSRKLFRKNISYLFVKNNEHIHQASYAPATLHGKFKYSRDWWPAPRSGGLVADPKQPKQIEHLSS